MGRERGREKNGKRMNEMSWVQCDQGRGWVGGVGGVLGRSDLLTPPKFVLPPLKGGKSRGRCRLFN